MLRLTAIFVAVCTVLISVSVGAILYMIFGLSGAEATVVAVAVMTALGLYITVTSKIHDRGDASMQIADLSRGTGDLARQVAELGRRVVAVEAKLDTAVDKAMAATEPLANEIGELGVLVTRLAESVAAYESAASRDMKATSMVVQPSPGATGYAPPPPMEPTFTPAPAVIVQSAPTPSPALSPPSAMRQEPVRSEPVLELSDPMPAFFKGMDRKAILEMLAKAIEDNRVDLYLQPIVTLPQRKVRYYEAMSRLKTDDGEVVPAAAFLEYAESSGLMPKLDNLLLFRCVQVVRRLLLKNRDIGLFCNIAAPTLTSQLFPQLLEFLEANKALNSALVFEFTQAAYRAMGPMEQEGMEALTERGFRFSMDNLTDLRFEPRDLAERGFRFIKAPAALLLNNTLAATSNIHPADMSDLLSRFGIDLIADKIEGETMVVDLLDYDVRFGQGFLFSPPRPVKAEALQGITERNDVVARDVSVADQPRRDGITVSDTKPASGSQRGVAALARGVAVRNG